MSLVDPLGKVLVEIRDDIAVYAISAGRWRGGEPAAGDALGPGHYQAFGVLSMLGHSRLKRAPVQEVRLLAKCYAATFQAATAHAAAVSDAVHARGHRISSTGVVIFGSFDDGDGSTSKDPDTGQPHADIVISVGALTSLIP